MLLIHSTFIVVWTFFPNSKKIINQKNKTLNPFQKISYKRKTSGNILKSTTMNTDQYCVVLNVLNVISTNILGFTFWGTSIEFVNPDDCITAGIVYFINKDEALNLQTGDRFLR